MYVCVWGRGGGRGAVSDKFDIEKVDEFRILITLHHTGAKSDSYEKHKLNFVEYKNFASV